MNKREKEVATLIKTSDLGLKLIGNIETRDSRCFVTVEAPNGKQNVFRTVTRSGDTSANYNFVGDLKRFARDNPATALAVALTKVDTKAKQSTLKPPHIDTKLLKEIKHLEEIVPSTKVTGVSVKTVTKLPEPKPLTPDIKTLASTQTAIKNGFPSVAPLPTTISMVTHPKPDKATPPPTVSKRLTRVFAHRPLKAPPTVAVKPPEAPLPKTLSVPLTAPAKAEFSTSDKETLGMTNTTTTSVTTKTIPVKRTSRALSMVEFYSLCEWTRKQDVSGVTSHTDFALDATKALGIDISPSTIPSVLEATGIVFPKMFRGLVPVTAQSQRDLAMAVVGIMKELGITPQPAVLKIAGLE